jgi:hypothetical protein
MVPEGQGGGYKRENYFYIYIFWNETSGQFQSNLIQTFLAWLEFTFIQMKVQIIFKGGVITKVQK